MAGSAELSPTVLGLIVVAAVVHAAWNLAIKRAGATGVGFLWLAFVVGALVFAPFGIASLAASGVELWRWALLAVVSGALQVGYFLLLQTGYRVGDVSVVYPLARGTGPLLAVVLAMLLLGERPGILALVGAGVIIAGVMVIGFAGGFSRARSHRSGVLFGLLIGVVIAVYTLWDSAAVTVGGMPVVGLYWGSVLFQALLAAPLALRERRAFAGTLQRSWPLVLTVGVLAPLGYILILLAIQQAPVSLVAPAREVSVVLVGLAGWLFFREPHPAQRLAGAAIVLAGVAMLAGG